MNSIGRAAALSGRIVAGQSYHRQKALKATLNLLQAVEAFFSAVFAWLAFEVRT